MSRSATREGSFTAGALAGSVTYVLGYVLTYLWQSGNVQDAISGYNTLVDFLGGDPIPTWKAVGWLFYNAHAVPFTYPAFGGGRVSRNFLADGSAPTLLYVLAPLLLVAAGFVLARVADTRLASTGAQAGVRVAAGYALLAVLGLLAFRHTAGDAVVHVQYVQGVLLAGVVYPVVFGALGGALGGLTTPE